MSGADQLLIRRTWRRIALQTAALFAIGVVALDLLAIGVVLSESRSDASRALAMAVNDPDALTNPPIDIVVYRWDAGVLRSSPGAPGGPIDPQAMDDQSTDDRVVQYGGRDYLVRTYHSGSATVQIGLDLTAQRIERNRLFMGLAVAGVVGMALAGGLGTLIARRAITPLGHAIERQQRFVADASHELRTPLTQLHTRAQLLELDLAGGAEPDRVRSDVTQLVRGTRQLGELVSELLLAASLRDEPQRLAPIDLAVLAEQAAEDERLRASQRQVEIAVRTDGAGSYVVPGVDAALRRVLTSLLDNALSHTPAGGRITVELAAAPDRMVVLRVHDIGEGFDPALAERMFERFYRGNHGDGRRFGLGLSLVREVVLSHGGTVAADGQPDGGACFTVRLPAWPESGSTVD